MKKPKQPTNNSGWIKPTPPNTINEIVESIRSSDVIISDLDRTIAPINILGALLSKLGRRKFVDAFLRNIGSLTRITQRYTDNYAKQHLYPDVLEFYKALPPNVVKILVTRNTGRIAESYCKALNFNRAYERQHDKNATIEQILREYPLAKSFVLFGDDGADEMMLNFLRKQQKEGRIDSVTGIYVARSSSPFHWNLNFDANMSQHYGALKRALLEYSNGSSLRPDQYTTHQIQ